MLLMIWTEKGKCYSLILPLHQKPTQGYQSIDNWSLQLRKSNGPGSEIWIRRRDLFQLGSAQSFRGAGFLIRRRWLTNLKLSGHGVDKIAKTCYFVSSNSFAVRGLSEEIDIYDSENYDGFQELVV